MIEPVDFNDIQPSSVDLHLGDDFQVFRNSRYPYIDPGRDQVGLTEQSWRLRPRSRSSCIRVSSLWGRRLSTSRCRMILSVGWRARARWAGWVCSFTRRPATWIRAGRARLTLELSNVANLPIVLTPGMKIGQISFSQMTTPVDRPYGHPELGSRYQGQDRATPSKMHLNPRGE